MAESVAAEEMTEVTRLIKNRRKMRNEWIAAIDRYDQHDEATETMLPIGPKALLRTYVVLCQQTGTELQIIVEIEGPSSLETHAKGRGLRTLGQFLHASDASKLAMRVL